MQVEETGSERELAVCAECVWWLDWLGVAVRTCVRHGQLSVVWLVLPHVGHMCARRHAVFALLFSQCDGFIVPVFLRGLFEFYWL